MVIKNYCENRLISTELIDNYDYTTNWYDKNLDWFLSFKKPFISLNEKPKKRKNKENYLEIDEIRQYFDVKQFTEFQFRINNRIDIYPKNKRYIDIFYKERGTYSGNTLLYFLQSRLKVKVPTNRCQ